MKALVTGGAGFIGHHLASAMLERGDDVVVLDDFSTGLRERLDVFGGRARVIEASILDGAALDQAMAGCEVVFHQAALASVERSFVDPILTNEVNVAGTVQVLLAAARNGVRRVLFAGSSSVYGVPDQLPCQEMMSPSPESPYGVSKLAAEYYLHTLGEKVGVETLTLRYFNVFGPGQDPQSDYAAVIPLFITSVLEARQPTINGDGSISRDFTYVDNVVSANLLAAATPGISGTTMNIACGERTTLLELLAAIGVAVGTDVEPFFGPARVGDIEHSLADISLARDTIGYKVVVPFDIGISRTVEWYRSRPIADG